MPRPPALLCLLVALAAGPALAEGREFGEADHRAQAALLAEAVSGPLGATALPGPACTAETSGAATLAADLLFHIAALDRAGHVAATCEPGPPGRRACTVTIGQAVPGSELRWSRIYQFERPANGPPDPATLACMTIP